MALQTHCSKPNNSYACIRNIVSKNYLMARTGLEPPHFGNAPKFHTHNNKIIKPKGLVTLCNIFLQQSSYNMFHATKLSFKQHISYNKTCFMPNISCLCNKFRKIFHATKTVS